MANRGEAVNAPSSALFTPAGSARHRPNVWTKCRLFWIADRTAARPPELIEKISPPRLESINLRGVFRFLVDRYADQILPSRQGAPITGTNG